VSDEQMRDMPVFVQILSFRSQRQDFNERKDTETINSALKELQEKGARIIDVKVNLAGTISTAAVYLITYEADAPITI
jgi:tagatose-1,6-bisphosphate aldolase